MDNIYAIVKLRIIKLKVADQTHSIGLNYTASLQGMFSLTTRQNHFYFLSYSHLNKV